MASLRDVDITASGRIAVLSDMVRRIAGVTDPGVAIQMLTDAIRRAYGPGIALHLSVRGLAPGQYRLLRLTDVAGRDRVEPPAGGPWAYEAAPVSGGGVLGELTAGARPRLLHDLDLAGDPVLGDALAGPGSLIFAPVIDPMLPIDFVALVHEGPRHFAVHDLEDLMLRANLVGAIAKGLYVGRQLEAANLRIAREIEQIARIQRTLLPNQLPQIPGLALAAFYQTFDRAGGDLYDFARMEGDPTTSDDDRWAILIADASGHGPAAATVCAIVHSIFHAYPQEPGRPAELIRHVNAHLCAKQIESSFVTAFLAFYQASTRELVCARAGHNPPIVMGARGADGRRHIRRLLNRCDGLPLGIDADAPFTEERVTVAPGELVVLYTDGIPEARNALGEEFGVAGIEAALADCPSGAAEAVARIADAVRAHQGVASSADDQTVVVMEGVGT